VTLQAVDFHNYTPVPLFQKRLLVVRVGGFGDLMWLAPIYRTLREQGAHITHCAFPHYLPVLNGFVDATTPYPIRADELAKYDAVAWLENIIEGRAVAPDEHPHDRLAAFFGLPPSTKKAEYILTQEEKDWAGHQWPRTWRKRVCLQPWSSALCKNYPPVAQLMQMMHTEGWEILVVGSPLAKDQSPPPVPKEIFDCTHRRMNMRQSIAMTSFCDMVVAPDSAFVHIAHALDMPCVGLFGSFHGKPYMKGYHGQPIQGDRPCSPCSWHPRGTPFPPDQPCAKHNICVALNKVSPEYVVTIAKRYIENGNTSAHAPKNKMPL
jgi:ADP-heptose:LPS heptosyltransferase